MNVAQLKRALLDARDTDIVVFQGNIAGEDDKPGETTYTTCLGPVFSAFRRRQPYKFGEFVINGSITEQE